MNHRHQDVSLAVQALLRLPEVPSPPFRRHGLGECSHPMAITQIQSQARHLLHQDESRYHYFTEAVVQRASPSTAPRPLKSLPFHHPRIVSAPPSPPPPPRTLQAGEKTSIAPVAAKPCANPVAKVEPAGPFYAGHCLLALPEDEEHLSPLHCFMRKHCVEVFTGREEGLVVGLRCRHCKDKENRAERAVCFPSSLKNIYHSIETWQRRHSVACRDIPAWCKREMAALLLKSRSGAGGRRLYWEESAKRIGMVDTNQGIKFIRPPGTVLEMNKFPAIQKARPSVPIVRPDDMDLDISGFLYMLLDQMETCYFLDQDRVGGRSKVKRCEVGYPGIQCKHCGGKAGFGRYFPLSQTALTSANSDRNIFNHLAKCRKCPAHIRDTLTQLVTQHGSTAKNKRGARKVFFERIWQRMHDDAP